MLEAECVISSDRNHNSFLNKKLSPNPTLDYTFITHNEIIGQPMEAIDLASTSHTVVSGNTIVGANRGYGGAVINVRNVGSWRATTEIVISGNKFRTDATIPSQSYALVAVGGCQPYGTKGVCDALGISNVTVTGNENTTSPLLPLFCRNPLVAPNDSITNILGFDAVNTPLCGLP